MGVNFFSVVDKNYLQKLIEKDESNFNIFMNKKIIQKLCVQSNTEKKFNLERFN